MKSLLISGILFLTFNVFAAPMVAYYEVPTSQADLKSASQFEIKKLSVMKNTDNVTSLKYVIPQELTGHLNEVEFTGVLDDKGGQLVSDHGTMNCLSNSLRMMCSVSYQQVDFDSKSAQIIMREKFKDLNLEKRLSVLEKFSTDPIGIIHIVFQTYHSPSLLIND